MVEKHGHSRVKSSSILWRFHHPDHKDYVHCEGPPSNSWRITHLGKKHGINVSHATGHGINGEPQQFRFTKKIGKLWDLESGVEVSSKKKGLRRLRR